MFKRIFGSRLPLLAYSPTKVFDERYMRSCFIAGALPVLDTEHMNEPETLAIVERLSSQDFLFGIRVGINDRMVIDYLSQNHVQNCDTVVFHYDHIDELDGFTCDLYGYHVLVETRHIGINSILNKLNPTALVLKGIEAQGKVSRHTSFILMQWYLSNSDIPVIIHGGVGMHTAAGFFAAGASGIVLDSQLYLTDESPLSEEFRTLLSTLDGGDSILLGDSLTVPYRCFRKLGTAIIKNLKSRELEMSPERESDELLYDEIRTHFTPMNSDRCTPVQSLFYLGQDAVFARHFVKVHSRLEDVIASLFQNISLQAGEIDSHDPIIPDSALAREHGTLLPIVQGPMANICDSVAFADRVCREGALPFLALGNLPPDQAEKLLREAVKELPAFGTGIIGFAAMGETLSRHFELVKKYKIPYALIAGGNPSQILDLESAGIKTYLHAPSMTILDGAVKKGCRRFIFEGNEAGGHIGSLTSMVLWELAVEYFLSISSQILPELSILYAGGVGTCFGSYFISGMASHLARAGAKIGIQAGTPYLFSKEIVESCAITERYQKCLMEPCETTVIGGSVGLPSRTVTSPFTEKIITNERERLRQGLSLVDRKTAFEVENFGALLIAAKGLSPQRDPDGRISLVQHSDEAQCEKGNFMSGESMTFFSNQLTIGEIHAFLTGKKQRLYDNLNRLEASTSDACQIYDEIAITGIGCIYPDALSKEEFWNNIIDKKYSIKKLDTERFDAELYYSSNRKDEDKSYTMIAATVDSWMFNHERFGYTEEEASTLSRSQKMILEAAFQAVEDAGYTGEHRLPSDRTSIVVGTCLSNEHCDDLKFKYCYPEFKNHLERIPEFTSLDSELQSDILNTFRNALSAVPEPRFPDGVAINIDASRIAKHLGTRGINYTVDAACATSLAAVENAMNMLLQHETDIAIAGGVQTTLAPETLVGFCKMGALSAEGSYPFDARADGFVLGEGAGVVVLKRLRDAVRDGDRIYGVIAGIGSSSDGRGKAIAAPRQEGQMLAIQRCFSNAKRDISPSDIGFIEAHGTSTLMGDYTEILTLKSCYHGSSPIAVSSIKSQIGHLLGGAGMAGLIKTVMALGHRTLPPNGLFEKLSDKFDLEGSPLYINRIAAEWKTCQGKDRMAAISAFGFGGINYHLIVREYTGNTQLLKRHIFNKTEFDYNDHRIVAVSVGTVLPGASNVGELTTLLEEGKEVLSRIPESRFHNHSYANESGEFNLPMLSVGVVTGYEFENLRYRIPPATVNFIDRNQLFALDAAGQVIEGAGLKEILKNHGNKVGVIIGTATGEHHLGQIIRTRIPLLHKLIMGMERIPETTRRSIAGSLAASLKARYAENTEDTVPGVLSNIVSGRIANIFNCNGPNYTIETECASAAVAMRTAILELRSGHSDFVITGGVDTNLSPPNLMAFHKIKVLSPDKARFFDKNSRGLVMSEGCALLLLTTWNKAREHGMRILGEFSGFSFKSFAAESMLSPTVPGFVETMEELYRNQAVRKSQLDYFDVFASTHKLVDSWEKEALTSVFTRGFHFGNSKTELGYFRSANAAVVAVKLLIMSNRRIITPHHSYNNETSIVESGSILVPPLFCIDLRHKSMIHSAANFFGLGGIVGHAVVSTFPGWLRNQFETRSTDMINATKSDSMIKTDDSGHTGEKIAVLLTGQGSQHAGMMKELYDTVPLIKEIMDRGDSLFSSMRGYSLLEMMFGDDSRINLTENTQPAVFLSSAALFEYLRQRGFTPDHFIGHSLGECTALFCNGMLSFENTLKLIMARSEAMKTSSDQTPGGIMVLFQNAGDTASLLRESRLTDVWIANKNSENQTAVSGSIAGIDAFCDYLNRRQLMYKKLPLSCAFHSPMLSDAARGLEEHLKSVHFDSTARFERIIANATASPYPQSGEAVKNLLVTQVVSPVEFIDSVLNLYNAGVHQFIEIGPDKTLTNALKNIIKGPYRSLPAVDPKAGETVSFNKLLSHLLDKGRIRPETVGLSQKAVIHSVLPEKDTVLPGVSAGYDDDSYRDFKTRNKERIEKILFDEYMKEQRELMLDGIRRYGFYSEKIMITGVSVGLPGKARRVFNDDNLDRLIEGNNFIDPLDPDDKERLLDKNITRLQKSPDGNATFIEILSTSEVIQLAGRLGYFNLKDYGIDEQFDDCVALAIASGLEALKDAKIPLVVSYRTTGTGRRIPEGLSLPEEMQNTTGVISTGVFTGWETLIRELNTYYYNKFYVKPYHELENIYYHLMECVRDADIKEQITEWYMKIRERRKVYGNYRFDRDFMSKVASLGAAHFARLIKAKGPNTHLSGACASTTQAIAVAEDWIRTGRCKRVIVIGGEHATSEFQNPWIGSGMLALGAATTEPVVSDAAKPFDSGRKGTILGSGAVAMILERGDSVKERGMQGQAEILGTLIGNSAYHTTRLDIDHIAREMKNFIDTMEKRHHITRQEYAKKCIFMSHETFTPARGGSADAEVRALKSAFPEDYRNIVITNTKGFTGHTMGAGIEDAIMVKSLQKRKTPPIANLRNVSDEFKDLRFSRGETCDVEYGLHFAAGFGSQFAMLFLRRTEENKTEDNISYRQWLTRISGNDNPLLVTRNNVLCVESDRPDSEKPYIAAKSGHTEVSPVQPVNVADVDAKPQAGHFMVTQVKSIIAGQTGYTADMLEDDLDLEADLGIDTVKQVEIFGKISAHFGIENTEEVKLRELNTIAKIAAFVGSRSIEPVHQTSSHSVEKTTSPGKESIGTIKSIIAGQTGYTIDMLEDDLDLEADLGIDTVKQVEIFGKISAHFGIENTEEVKLRELNTIAKIASYVESFNLAAKNITAHVDDQTFKLNAVTPTAETLPGYPKKIRRFKVDCVQEDSDQGIPFDFAGKTILITSDNHGFTEKISEILKNKGASVISLGTRDTDYITDFNDPAVLGKTIKVIAAKHSSIDGIVHLLPIDYYYMRKNSGTESLMPVVKSLFIIIKELYGPLDRPDTLISALSFNSVVFPYAPDCPPIYPGFAGIAGMLKTVNKEMKGTLAKIVDFAIADPASDIDRIVHTYLDELQSGDTRVESGYRYGERYQLKLREAPAEKNENIINPGDTLLITGGTSGITFQILKRLVEIYELTLIICDYTDISELDKGFLADTLDETSIMEKVKQSMEGAKPLAIKKEVARIMKIRSKLRNLEYLKQKAAVTYHAVDVADYNALAAVIKNHRKIDGVLHAAGMEESQFITKKGLPSFNRVFDTKVAGAINLIKLLKNRKYRCFMAFSSVTARFGNEGQVDYTAANDMLGRLLHREQQHNPECIYRVIDWTAWDGTGMATSETVKKVLLEKGIDFLAVEEGIRFFMDELADRNTLEAVVTGTNSAFDTDKLFAKAKKVSAPFLDSLLFRDETGAVYTRVLDLQRDLFLFDHSRKGTPIFLGATGIEAMAEAAQTMAVTGHRLSKLTGFTIPYGIKILKGRPKELEIRAEMDRQSPDAIHCEIISRFKRPDGKITIERTVHYRGAYHFSINEPESIKVPIPEFKPVMYNGDLQDIVYHPERLFMHGLFKTVEDILSFDGATLITRIRCSSDREFFKGIVDPEFITNVPVIDAMFQTAGMFEVLTTNEIILPYAFGKMSFYRPVMKNHEYLCITGKTKSGEKTNVYDLYLTDYDGNLYLSIENFEMIKVDRVSEDFQVKNLFRLTS